MHYQEHHSPEEKLFKDKMPGIIAYLEKHAEQIFESRRSEFENVFSLDALEHLAQENETLRSDIDGLITVSRLYAEVVSVLSDEVVTHSDIEFEGLLQRQKEAHDRFEEYLHNLFAHAEEQHVNIPFDGGHLSRVQSLQIALFIAYQDIVGKNVAREQAA